MPASVPDARDPARSTMLASAIAEIARRTAAAGPPPRGVPFFGIDRESPTPLARIEDLATRGIFRKYEHVLDLGGGLGATTRYLAARLGCTATATAASAAEAAAGSALTARAGLDWRVFHIAADAARLPFATAAFTHVWIIETLPRLGPAGTVLDEAFRVLRPGGHLGVQEIVRRPAGPDASADDLADAHTRHGELGGAGFVEIETRTVADAAPDASSQGDAAWRQLARRLGDTDAHVRGRRALTEGLAAGVLGVVQLTARRP